MNTIPHGPLAKALGHRTTKTAARYAKNVHAVALGKRGGSVTSERKAEAARLNGLRGGTPGWRVTDCRPATAGLVYVCAHTDGSTPVELLSGDDGCDRYTYATAAGDAVGPVPQAVRLDVAAAVRRYIHKRT